MECAVVTPRSRGRPKLEDSQKKKSVKVRNKVTNSRRVFLGDSAATRWKRLKKQLGDVTDQWLANHLLETHEKMCKCLDIMKSCDLQDYTMEPNERQYDSSQMAALEDEDHHHDNQNKAQHLPRSSQVFITISDTRFADEEECGTRTDISRPNRKEFVGGLRIKNVTTGHSHRSNKKAKLDSVVKKLMHKSGQQNRQQSCGQTEDQSNKQPRG